LDFACARDRRSSLDELDRLINWHPVATALGEIHAAAKGGPAWPPLALFKAMLITVWYDLSDVKLAEALDDRASFRLVRSPAAPRDPWLQGACRRERRYRYRGAGLGHARQCP
jgi:hypothetical protein